MKAERIAEILSEHGLWEHRRENLDDDYCDDCSESWPCKIYRLATLAAEAERLRAELEDTRAQLERDFAIRCRCDFVTKLFAGIERCVGCRARDRIAAIDALIGAAAALETGAQG